MMRLKPRLPYPSSLSARHLFIGLMTLLLLLTAYTRLAQLTELPPGMHPDIGYYLSDGLRISRTFPDGLFLDDRPEPFWRFYLALLITLLDAPVFTHTFAGMTIGLLTVALTYRATLELLRLWRWLRPDEQRLGALLAAAAVAANMVLLFMNREGYRVALVPLSIAFFVFAWARAWRLRRGWGMAGFAAGLPVNTYISGLMSPVAAVGILLVFMLLGRPAARPKLRQIAALLLWMGIAITPQAVLFLNNPDAYARVDEIDANQGAPEISERLIDFWTDFATSIHAFYATGNYRPNYNTPDTPFLNPWLAAWAAVGAIVLLMNRSSLATPLIFILLGVMTLPGTLSDEPDHPFRLVGTFIPLAMLTGVGLAGIAFSLRRVPPRLAFFGGLIRRAVMLLTLGLVVGSVGFTWWRYEQHFQDERFLPDVYGWLSFAHYYSITWNDFLADLQKIDRPVYVPLPRLDTSLSAWQLRATAFPHVTTLDAIEFDPASLPVGDLWYPYLAEYSFPVFPLNPPPEQFALLTPGENGRGGSITILPPMQAGAAQVLYERVQAEGAPLYASNAWMMGWLLADVTPETLTQPPVEWHPSGARFADGALELVGYEATHDIERGTTWRATLYWRVLRPIRYDLFNTISLVHTDLTAVETQNHWLYRWIYPAVFWEVGSIVPQMVVFTIPDDLPAEAYTLGISLYTEPNNVLVSGTDATGNPLPDNWLLHQNHRVPLASVALPTADDAPNVTYGDSLRLKQVELDTIAPGATVNLTLTWDVLARPGNNYIQLLHLRDANGQYIVQDTLPFGGQYPTNVWYPGDVVQAPYTLNIPADSQPPYELMIGWYEYPSLVRLPAVQAGQALPDNLFVMPDLGTTP
jgi:hypothetical protein